MFAAGFTLVGPAVSETKVKTVVISCSQVVQPVDLATTTLTERPALLV